MTCDVGVRGKGSRVGAGAAKAMAALTVGVLAGMSGLLGAGVTGTGAPPAGAASASIPIAVEGPMTGSQASTGVDMLRGAQLAVARVNAAGGVMGRSLRIIPVDDKAEPSVAVSVARRAVSQGAVGVVGPFNSAVGVKNLPTYRRAGLSIVRLTSAASTEGYGVTTQPMVGQIAPVEAAALTDQLHATSVDVLYDPSTYTAGIARQLVTTLKADHVSVPVNRSLSPTASAGQRGQAIDAVRAHPSSVVYLAMYGPQAGLMAKGLHGLAVEQSRLSVAAGKRVGSCFVDLAAQGPSFVAAAGNAAASACLNSGVPAASQLPLGAAYSAAYLAKFHRSPDTWGAFTYDSVAILAQAMITSRQVRGSAVRAALADTKDFDGVTGTTTIEQPSGNRSGPPVVILSITSAGRYVVDPTWAQATGYPLTSGSATSPLPAP